MCAPQQRNRHACTGVISVPNITETTYFYLDTKYFISLTTTHPIRIPHGLLPQNNIFTKFPVEQNNTSVEANEPVSAKLRNS